jgi:hypothetical protein
MVATAMPAILWTTKITFSTGTGIHCQADADAGNGHGHLEMRLSCGWALAQYLLPMALLSWEDSPESHVVNTLERMTSLMTLATLHSGKII